jgi:hypothetical protein
LSIFICVLVQFVVHFNSCLLKMGMGWIIIQMYRTCPAIQAILTLVIVWIFCSNSACWTVSCLLSRPWIGSQLPFCRIIDLCLLGTCWRCPSHLDKLFYFILTFGLCWDSEFLLELLPCFFDLLFAVFSRFEKSTTSQSKSKVVYFYTTVTPGPSAQN